MKTSKNNLLKETKKVLKEFNKSIDDIIWIGSENNYIDIEKFFEIADTEYTKDYYEHQVACNMFIVGKDWWLERHEFDGDEWWEYKSVPTKPKNKIELKALTRTQANYQDNRFHCSYVTLEDLNKIN